MRILGVIPARYHSSRFPGKPLADIDGQSMVRRVYEKATQSTILDRLIVATDDQRIADEVTDFGGEVTISKAIHKNGTERCAEVLKQYPDYDFIINIQCDEPFFSPEVIDQFYLLFESNVMITSIAQKIVDHASIDDPNVVKVVFDINHKALYFSRSAIPYSSGKTSIHKHVGIYGYRADSLLEISALPESNLEKAEKLEQLRWLENGFPINMIIAEGSFRSVDSPSDLKLQNIQ